MVSKVISANEMDWFNPGVVPPPFETKLLLMLAGTRSNDACRTYEAYTEVVTGYVQESGPSDDSADVTAHDEYIAGDHADFLSFQFFIKGENGDESDWYSDSIVAWAEYPLNVERIAVATERKRQELAS